MDEMTKVVKKSDEFHRMTQTHASTLHSEKNKSTVSAKDRVITEEKSCSSESEVENELKENP